MDLDLTPVEVAARCRHLPGLAFFDSALPDPSGFSLIAACPDFTLEGADWDLLRRAVHERQLPPSSDDGLPHGFAAGSVDYEGGFSFGFHRRALFFRHAEERWYELGDMRSLLGDAPLEVPAPTGFPQASRLPEGLYFRPTIDCAAYCAMVRRAQEYIAAGDIYQVNLAHCFEADWDGDPFTFYQALRHYSPAPYGAFLALGGRHLLSSSPESFLKISGRSIRTRPIKGTRPRRADPHADERSAYDLLTSQKEVAELVMITDLQRNDLGAICEFGSVSVRDLLRLERYEQVFHLTSTVEGRLRSEMDHVSALKACFPGGSITGAPKKRACEIIAELEPGPRGAYTGAIGWFGFNCESQFNIAIRTAVAAKGKVHFHVGAGIVADSDPEREWQETLDKAAGLLLAAARLPATALPTPAPGADGIHSDGPHGPHGVHGVHGVHGDTRRH